MRALDLVIDDLARRQHGVVSGTQLVAAGATRNAIAHRVATGRLTRLHRNVYRVGPTHTPLTSLMAATLACGPTAALSHHAAAALHGIRKQRPGPIDVTVTRGHARKRKGLRIHRARSLETTTIHGIRVTTLIRTLFDIAPELTQRELRRAIEEAQIQRKLDHSSLTDAVDEHRGHRGAVALRAAAIHTTEPRLTRSEAERKLIELIDAAGLPRPKTNVKVGMWEVDALWEEQRLAVEVDGFAVHGTTRDAFERDRRKTADLTAAGLRVSRVTWRQLLREREVVVARLAAALTSTPASGRPLAAAAALGSPPGPPRS